MAIFNVFYFCYVSIITTSIMMNGRHTIWQVGTFLLQAKCIFITVALYPQAFIQGGKKWLMTMNFSITFNLILCINQYANLDIFTTAKMKLLYASKNGAYKNNLLCFLNETNMLNQWCEANCQIKSCHLFGLLKHKPAYCLLLKL